MLVQLTVLAANCVSAEKNFFNLNKMRLMHVLKRLARVRLTLTSD